MRAIGIVLAGGNSSRMGILANKRAVAAMPIAGSYRSIDFALSNMSNSHVQKVAVCTQFNARSLNQHLNSSKWWDFGRKQGGLFVLTPTMTTENNSWYRGTADAMYQNISDVTLKRPLSEGEYKATIKISTVALDKSTALNGANVETVLIAK